MAATRLDRGDDAALNDEVDGVVRLVCHPDLAGDGPLDGEAIARLPLLQSSRSRRPSR